MAKDWYQQSINALQLNGKGERTQEAYTRALRMLVQFTGKRPAAISEQELEAYFLHRRNVDRWSPNTMRICYCGIRFFFVHVLKRDWHLFQILRAKSESRLPAVLSREEVRTMLSCVRTPHNYAFLSTVYACGLRLNEALHLEVGDIDSARMMLHVHRGKGAKDRFVPLPKTALSILRTHWRPTATPVCCFPPADAIAVGQSPQTPMAISSVQGAFRAAKRAAGYRQARRLDSHASAFLCHPSARSRGEPARDPAKPRPLEPGDHHGLPASDRQGQRGRLCPDRHRDGGSVTMGAIQDLFRRHGPDYLARFAARMPREHRKVIEAIIGCASPANGSLSYGCESCAEQFLLPRCCGNRHCPGCQQHKAYAWLNTQLQRQLPTHYFMLTFTVPAELRAFIRGHQRIGYAGLFEASAGAIKKLAPDPKYIGADTPGFFGVLHTWGRQLHYHPHIHYLVPGGAVSSTDGRWHASSSGFYLPVHALSKIFRAKFRDAMDAAGLLAQIPDSVWITDWNVNCQAVGSGHTTLKYLARYVFKVAISDSRIVRFDDNQVWFRYRKVHSNRMRTMALPILEFMRRFLTHVLPTGFMKVRYFGFVSPSFSIPIEELRARVELAHGFALHDAHTNIAPPAAPAPLCCRHCGGRLRYQRIVLPLRPRSLPQLASPATMHSSASG